MPGNYHCLLAGVLMCAASAIPGSVHAQQKSEENAVTSADDAFGTSVGLESTGIYSEHNTRGFRPLDAGNARLDGIYFDPVSLVTLRIRASQAMRVGVAALEYPFPAPTGIVDNRLRTARNDFHTGVALHRQRYGSYVLIADSEIPIVKNRLALVAGISTGHAVSVERTTAENYSFVVKPVIRFGGVEISPFYSANYVRDAEAKPLVILESDFVPAVPSTKRYFGQEWAENNVDNVNYGTTVKAGITDRLSLRAGLFNSKVLRRTNFTEYFVPLDRSGTSFHGVIADPRQDLHSWSGEAQLAYSFGSNGWHHRLIGGFRGRDRYTEFGGSEYFDFDPVQFGVPDPQPEPDFMFSPVNLMWTTPAYKRFQRIF